MIPRGPAAGVGAAVHGDRHRVAILLTSCQTPLRNFAIKKAPAGGHRGCGSGLPRELNRHQPPGHFAHTVDPKVFG